MSIFPRPNRGPLWAVLLIALSGIVLEVFGYDLMSLGVTFILILLAAILVADWFIEKRVRNEIDLNTSRHEGVRELELLRMMTPEQIEAAHEARVVRRHVFNGDGPKHDWYFPDGTSRAPELFKTEEVRAVWLVCTEWGFAPLSTWNDETRNRKCATAMMYHFLYRGYIDREPNGNKPALWRTGGYEAAAKALWED